MSAPSGVGWWIWRLPQLLNQGGYAELAAVCRANGISYVLVKAGDANNRWQQFYDAVGPLKAAGLNVFAWIYAYAGNPPHTPDYSPESTPAGEAAVAIAALDAGADGLVIDYEAEAEGRLAECKETWQQIRAAHPGAWLGWSPDPRIHLHTPDNYRIACRYANAHLPMMYLPAFDPPWNDFDVLAGLWDKWSNIWASEGLPRLPLMPIGWACRNATVENIADFGRRCKEEGYPAISWWELSQASAAQQGAAAEVAQEWTGMPIPTPIPTPEPEPAPVQPSLLELLDALWGRSNVIDEHASEVEAQVAELEEAATHLREMAAELHAEATAIRDYLVMVKKAAGLEA